MCFQKSLYNLHIYRQIISCFQDTDDYYYSSVIPETGKRNEISPTIAWSTVWWSSELSLSHVWLFCNPTDCSLPGSSVHGISQARIMEWVAMSFSRGSSWPRDWTCISCIAGGFCTAEPLSNKRHISDHSSERKNFSRVGLRQQEFTGQNTVEEEATGVRACKLNIKSCTHRVNSKRLD